MIVTDVADGIAVDLDELADAFGVRTSVLKARLQDYAMQRLHSDASRLAAGEAWGTPGILTASPRDRHMIAAVASATGLKPVRPVDIRRPPTPGT